MKKALLLFLSLMSGAWGYGQSLGPEVIATAGEQASGSTAQISWTLGEPVIETFSGNSAILTQGFHQTNLMITALEDLAADFRVRVYPNPTAAQVQVEAPEAPTAFSLELTDATGRTLQTEAEASQFATRSLDLSGYAPGWYLLRLHTADGKTIKTFKIVKTH